MKWIGEGEEISVKPIAEAARIIEVETVAWTDSDRDRLEGRLCATLFEALQGIPVEVLDDRGFWRYLALAHFWDFIAWREEEPFRKGNYLKYVDATTNTESVLPRMYLRAQALGGMPYAAGAATLTRAGDFWRSHVLRVRTGSAPPLTRAFAEKQASFRLSTGPLRAAAKRLTRTWTNVVLHTYDDAEAASLIDEIWNDPTSS